MVPVAATAAPAVVMATAPAPAMMMSASATVHLTVTTSATALDLTDRIVLAHPRHRPALLPSRAEAGIAIASTETKTATSINKIRLIVFPPGREAAACYHNFPI